MELLESSILPSTTNAQNITFNSGELFVAEITAQRIKDLTTKTDPEYVQKLLKQAGKLTTTIHHLQWAIESNANYFFKTYNLHPQLHDPEVTLCFDTMSLVPRQKRHSYAAWTFRWSAESILKTLGISRKVRRDINPNKLMIELRDLDYLMLSPDSLHKRLELRAVDHFIHLLSNPIIHSDEDANYFTLSAEIIKKISSCRAGMFYNTSLTRPMRTGQLALLRLILSHLDQKETPRWAPIIWIKSFYNGKKPFKDVSWSYFKDNFLGRHLDFISSQFNLELTLGEQKEGRKKTVGAWLNIKELGPLCGQRIYVREKEVIFNTGGQIEFEFNKDTKSSNVPLSHEVPPTPQEKQVSNKRLEKLSFDVSMVTQEDINELVGFYPELADIPREDFNKFISAKHKDFIAYKGGTQQTVANWRRQWINYAKRGWATERDLYLIFGFDKAAETINFIKPHVAILMNKTKDSFTEQMARDLLAITLDQFKEYNTGKRFNKTTWENNFWNFTKNSDNLNFYVKSHLKET